MFYYRKADAAPGWLAQPDGWASVGRTDLALGIWGVAAENPTRPAITDADGTTITYGELAARSNQLVRGLRDLGLRHGDVVAAVLANEPAMLELYAAALQGGFYLTPVNHHLTGTEIGYILGN